MTIASQGPTKPYIGIDASGAKVAGTLYATKLTAALATLAIADTETGTLHYEALIEGPRAADSAAANGGDPVYLDDDGDLSTLPGDKLFVGILHRAVAAGATALQVQLKPYAWAPGITLTLAATGASTVTANAARNGGSLVILCSNSAAKTINLPAPADVGAGYIITVKKPAGGAFVLTLDPAGTDTINGSATLATIDANNDYVVLQSDGATNYNILVNGVA
jgi:hypothetical protein